MHLTGRKPFMEKMPFSVAPTAIKAHKHNNTVLLIVEKARNDFSTRSGPLEWQGSKLQSRRLRGQVCQGSVCLAL